MGLQNYDTMNYSQLKQLYLEKREEFNLIAERNRKPKLSSHVPCLKKNLISKIGLVDMVLNINDSVKSLNVTSKILQKTNQQIRAVI